MLTDEDNLEAILAVVQAGTDLSDIDREQMMDTARELLEVATLGSGAFRRFKGVLYSYPEAQENQFDFIMSAQNDA